MNVFVFIICSVVQLHVFAQESKNKVYCGSKVKIAKQHIRLYIPKGLMKEHQPCIANKQAYTFPETKARKLKRRRPKRMDV